MKKNGTPPSKAPAKLNPLLPDNMQDSFYKVVGYKIQPIVSLKDNVGLEVGNFEPGVAVRVFEADYRKSIPEIVAKAGLQLERMK